jgi:hypothetical protein
MALSCAHPPTRAHPPTNLQAHAQPTGQGVRPGTALSKKSTAAASSRRVAAAAKGDDGHHGSRNGPGRPVQHLFVDGLEVRREPRVAAVHHAPPAAVGVGEDAAERTEGAHAALEAAAVVEGEGGVIIDLAPPRADPLEHALACSGGAWGIRGRGASPTARVRGAQGWAGAGGEAGAGVALWGKAAPEGHTTGQHPARLAQELHAWVGRWGGQVAAPVRGPGAP